jgi:precorrin-4/cobalt-precorrin-4 C11-methyltransferase
MKVIFIGAGPGAPDLITLRGRDAIASADIVIYAGSLVNPEILGFAREGAEVHDSASMSFDEVTGIYSREKVKDTIVARVHTGDPSLYGAVQEQIDWCEAEGIECEVIPGVSSFSAAAAAINQELTLPAVSQTVIITRLSGRTKVPESEDLEKLAASGATMAIFLSVQAIDEVVARLSGHYGPRTPVRVLYRVTWPDERVIAGTLADIAEKVRGAKIGRQAIILVGGVLGRNYEKSKLYDPKYSHGFRKAKE